MSIEIVQFVLIGLLAVELWNAKRHLIKLQRVQISLNNAMIDQTETTKDMLELLRRNR